MANKSFPCNCTAPVNPVCGYHNVNPPTKERLEYYVKTLEQMLIEAKYRLDKFNKGL